MNAGVTSSSRMLLDFGAGFLFGLSMTIALFAAMEEDVGPLSHAMLLAALAVLALAFGLKLVARGRSRPRGAPPPAGRLRDAGRGDTGWTVEVPATRHAEARAAASSSNDQETSREERMRAALPELKAAQRNTQTTAEGDSCRL